MSQIIRRPVANRDLVTIFRHEVFRVLHGARDIPGILAEEFGVEADAGDDEAEE